MLELESIRRTGSVDNDRMKACFFECARLIVEVAIECFVELTEAARTYNPQTSKISAMS